MRHWDATWLSTIDIQSDVKLRVNEPSLMFHEGWEVLNGMSNLIVSELIYKNDALIAAHEFERWIRDRNTSMVANKSTETRRITVTMKCSTLLLNSRAQRIFFSFSSIDFDSAETDGQNRF